MMFVAKWLMSLRHRTNFRTPRKIDNLDAHRDLAIHLEQDHDIEKEEAEKVRIREENRKLAEER